MTKEDELTAGLRAELARVDARLAEVKRPQNCGTGHCSCIECVVEPAPVQEGRDWSLLEATQESLREHMAEIKRLKAAQPAPVKTYHDGKPWPVQPVVSLQCAHCHVTIETLNDKVTQLMAAREPLTDAQILAANYPDGEENEATIAAPDVELIGFARAIEAAHGITKGQP
jgi:ferredoxin